MYTDAFLYLSNIFFLVPFIKAVHKHRWTRSAVYFLLVFVSGFYHACYSAMDLCLVTHAVHHELDFFLSLMLIPLTGLYFIDFGTRFAFLERYIIIGISFATFLIQSDPTLDINIVQYALVGFSGVLIIIGLILYGRQYDWSSITLGLLLTVTAFAFFIMSQQHPSEYWILHGLWHIFAAFGQYFLLDIRKAAPRYAAMDSQIKPIIMI